MPRTKGTITIKLTPKEIALRKKHIELLIEYDVVLDILLEIIDKESKQMSIKTNSLRHQSKTLIDKQ